MRDHLINLSLALGSVLFCFLILEGILRVGGYSPFRTLLNGRELILTKSDNPILRYELTPNSEGQAWRAPVKINSHGFRDREFSPVKPNGVYRIGVIGDSITFGNYLPLEETFPKRLERTFQARALRVEVLNLAVGGYDTCSSSESHRPLDAGPFRPGRLRRSQWPSCTK